MGRILHGIPGVHVGPVLLKLPAPIHRGLHVSGNRIGHVEGLLRVPSEVGLNELYFVIAERRTVCRMGVLKVGAAVTDMGAKLDQGGTALFSPGAIQSQLKGIHIVSVAFDNLNVPAVRLVPCSPVLSERKRRVAVDGNVIVVVDNDEIVQTEVPGET